MAGAVSPNGFIQRLSAKEIIWYFKIKIFIEDRIGKLNQTETFENSSDINQSIDQSINKSIMVLLVFVNWNWDLYILVYPSFVKTKILPQNSESHCRSLHCKVHIIILWVSFWIYLRESIWSLTTVTDNTHNYLVTWLISHSSLRSWLYLLEYFMQNPLPISRVGSGHK